MFDCTYAHPMRLLCKPKYYMQSSCQINQTSRLHAPTRSTGSNQNFDIHDNIRKPEQPGQPVFLIFATTYANQSNQVNQNLDIRDNIHKPEQPEATSFFDIQTTYANQNNP